MTILGNKERSVPGESIMTDYSKRRLLTYADSFKELADSLDFGYETEGEDRDRILQQQRLWEKQQMLCKNMWEMSHILSRMATEVFQYVRLPKRLYKKIVQALRMEKIYVTDLFYIRDSVEGEHTKGQVSLGVKMYTEKSGGYRIEDVADMLSVLTEGSLIPGVTTPYRLDGEEKYYVFVEEPYLMVMPGYAKAVRENENISGDNYAIVESVKGKTTVLLSDGMGSGERACEDSEKVLDLMEKLLEAGYETGKAMDLLNNAMMVSEGQQNMSTLDVCSIDLYSGMCSFQKAGGADTFLKSNKYVEEINMNTLPLGIVQSGEREVITRELIENDYIIMVTDGITDALAAYGYDKMLSSYLENLQETNPTEMARKILQFAIKCSQGRIMDDMLVVVLGIFRGR